MKRHYVHTYTLALDSDSKTYWLDVKKNKWLSGGEITEAYCTTSDTQPPTFIRSGTVLSTLETIPLSLSIRVRSNAISQRLWNNFHFQHVSNLFLRAML